MPVISNVLAIMCYHSHVGSLRPAPIGYRPYISTMACTECVELFSLGPISRTIFPSKFKCDGNSTLFSSMLYWSDRYEIVYVTSLLSWHVQHFVAIWYPPIFHRIWITMTKSFALQWRHSGRDGVSNHQPHNCLLNRLFRRNQRKHQSFASLAFVTGIQRWPVNSQHKRPVTRKMFPFDDVTMVKWASPSLAMLGNTWNFCPRKKLQLS